MLENSCITEFPRFEHQQTHSLDKAYPLANLCSLSLTLLLVGMTILLSLLVLPDVSELQADWRLRWALPLVALLYPWVWVSSRARCFAVRQEDVSYYSGVFSRSVIIQPLVRLQHIEITRGVIERIFGLATLKLYSAGGGSHALAIPGLKYAVAQALREQISTSRSLSSGQ